MIVDNIHIKEEKDRDQNPYYIRDSKEGITDCEDDYSEDSDADSVVWDWGLHNLRG